MALTAKGDPKTCVPTLFKEFKAALLSFSVSLLLSRWNWNTCYMGNFSSYCHTVIYRPRGSGKPEVQGYTEQNGTDHTCLDRKRYQFQHFKRNEACRHFILHKNLAYIFSFSKDIQPWNYKWQLKIQSKINPTDY